MGEEEKKMVDLNIGGKLLNEDEIKAKVKELAKEIETEFMGEEIYIVEF